jgi:hypothetical protein
MVRYLQEISRIDQVESENGENRWESISLVVIVVMASLAVVALLVAFNYYWYIKNKVRKRFNTEKSLPPRNELVSPMMNSSSQIEAQVFTFKQQ